MRKRRRTVKDSRCCATSDDDQGEEKSRPARVYWPIPFYFLLTATQVPLPMNFPSSHGPPSRLIISNKRRRNGRNPVLRRAVVNLIIFYGRGFRAGCRANFSFFVWNDNLTRTSYSLYTRIRNYFLPRLCPRINIIAMIFTFTYQLFSSSFIFLKNIFFKYLSRQDFMLKILSFLFPFLFFFPLQFQSIF